MIYCGFGRRLKMSTLDSLNIAAVRWVSMVGTNVGPIEKMELDMEETKTCKDCHHECHCSDPMHADEYGLCTCEECKC